MIIATDIKDKLGPVFARHAGRKDELIPVLQEAQDELGYLPIEAMREIGKFLKMPESDIFGVATFYAQFKFVPVGHQMVRVCRGTACHVKGSPRIIDEVAKHLGIQPGETTDDMEYTLETIACFGSCALAPVMVVNEAVYGRMTPKKVVEILKK